MKLLRVRITMSTSEEAPTPKFAAAADALIASVERLQDDSEALELAALRLRNMILTQRQWCRRAARRGPAAARAISESVQDDLLERLLRAEEDCQALLLKARGSEQGED